MVENLDSIVKLNNISKGFYVGDTHVEILKNIYFDVAPGETVAIVGASGIGKSTLLHIIGTLDRPDSGELWFNNSNVLNYSGDQLANFRNRAIGFVFQFHHLLPEFTALENAMMPMLIDGYSKDKAENAAEKILKRVGLGHRLLNQAGALSGGEQQRVAIARAIVRNPQLLLADEPTGNLDRKNSRQIHELLDELNKEFGMTTIVVTHNMELAAYMKKSVTLFEGQVKTEIS